MGAVEFLFFVGVLGGGVVTIFVCLQEIWPHPKGPGFTRKQAVISISALFLSSIGYLAFEPRFGVVGLLGIMAFAALTVALISYQDSVDWKGSRGAFTLFVALTLGTFALHYFR